MGRVMLSGRWVPIADVADLADAPAEVELEPVEQDEDPEVEAS